MRKRKNGERNYRKIFLKTIIGIIGIALLTLSIPTLYSIVTYYHLPDSYDKPLKSYLYKGSVNPYEICVYAGYVQEHIFTSPKLHTRIAIDDKVASFSEIQIEIYHHIPSFDLLTPMPEVVCTTQSELTVGEHEVIVFINYSSNLQWQAQGRWIVHVDETGLITDA